MKDWKEGESILVCHSRFKVSRPTDLLYLFRSAKRAGQAVETFKNSERVNVLLLHSEAQSSGLNLLCANRVFILEPLLNHGLELQAISRVSRIGATKPSQIFCLYARETVEERILHWSARNNRSLYLKDGNETESKIDSALLDIKSRGNRGTNPNKKGEMRGDFVSNEKDLLSCLFDQSIFVPRVSIFLSNVVAPMVAPSLSTFVGASN